MKTTTVLAFLSLALCCTSTAYAAPIEYRFNNYPTEQGSGTQSGLITVDESLGSSPGVLETVEITAWQVTVTGHSSLPDITFGTTSQQGVSLAISIFGTVGVSATELTLPQPSVDTTNRLQLADNSSGGGSPFFGQLKWTRTSIDGAHVNVSEQYRLVDGNGTAPGNDDVTYWDYNVSGFSPLGGGDPWVIATVPDGDFDNNGIVDGLDFLKWQIGMSPIPFSQSDLALWESQYGGPPPVSAVSAVPEPTTCALALAALCLAIGRRRAH